MPPKKRQRKPKQQAAMPATPAPKMPTRRRTATRRSQDIPTDEERSAASTPSPSPSTSRYHQTTEDQKIPPLPSPRKNVGELPTFASISRLPTSFADKAKTLADSQITRIPSLRDKQILPWYNTNPEDYPMPTITMIPGPGEVALCRSLERKMGKAIPAHVTRGGTRVHFNPASEAEYYLIWDHLIEHNAEIIRPENHQTALHRRSLQTQSTSAPYASSTPTPLQSATTSRDATPQRSPTPSMSANTPRSCSPARSLTPSLSANTPRSGSPRQTPDASPARSWTRPSTPEQMLTPRMSANPSRDASPTLPKTPNTPAMMSPSPDVSQQRILAPSPKPTTPTSAEQKANNGTTKERTKFPPIVVERLLDWPLHFKELQARLGHPVSAQAYKKGIRFLPKSGREHETIQDYLLEAELQQPLSWFTYSPNHERSLKLAFKGLPDTTTPEHLSEDLKHKGFSPEWVKSIETTHGRQKKIFFVRLARKPGIFKIYYLEEVLGMTGVTVEAWRGKKGPAQCHRCQGFRHTSVNCHRPFACVRCGGPHAARDCRRPLSEPPTCANCGGPHTANNLAKCPVYHREARNRRATTTAHTVQRTTPAPATTQMGVTTTAHTAQRTTPTPATTQMVDDSEPTASNSLMAAANNQTTRRPVPSPRVRRHSDKDTSTKRPKRRKHKKASGQPVPPKDAAQPAPAPAIAMLQRPQTTHEVCDNRNAATTLRESDSERTRQNASERESATGLNLEHERCPSNANETATATRSESNWPSDCHRECASILQATVQHLRTDISPIFALLRCFTQLSNIFILPLLTPQA